MNANSSLLLICLFASCLTNASAEPPASDSKTSKSSKAANVNWPSFRGPNAAGVRDHSKLPLRWDVESGQNVRWKTPIEGFGHSSPIVWGEQLFVTSAISSAGNDDVEIGLFGSGDASQDRSKQSWIIACLNQSTGKVVWQESPISGVPQDKRHTKASYANSTPATDGRYVVAIFGSEGVYCYDVKGNLVWKRDLGRLDAGAYDIPSYEWGTGSSPIIYKDLVILQIDTQERQFICGLDIKSGKTVWETPRDDFPSWATPTIVEHDGHVELVANGSKRIRGYDPASGKELWTLGGSSKITVPTPLFHRKKIIVCSGRHPESPIFAIRPGSSGDITLSGRATSNEQVAWSLTRFGPYISTPIAYRNSLFVLHGNGVFTSYDIENGHSNYRYRVPHRGGGFSASPVAADGKVYAASEDGDVFVVQIDPDFEVLSTNTMKEPIFATPAIAQETLFVRTLKHVVAVGKSPVN